MKRLSICYRLILLISIVPVCLYGQSNKLVTQNSQLSVSGTSTLHDWEIAAENVKGHAKIKTGNGQTIEISEMLVEIPTLGLKSGKSIMDKKTYNALKEDQYPLITYKLIGLTEIQNTGDNSWSLKASGTLEIGGIPKEILMSVNAKSADEYINFQGQITIDMTEFRIDPPTAVMGTIKTGKDVTIQFNINFSKIKSQSNENSN